MRTDGQVVYVDYAEIDSADAKVKKERSERRILTSTILLALFIIIAMVGLVTLIVLSEPKETTEVFQENGVDISAIMQAARDIMGRH